MKTMSRMPADKHKQLAQDTERMMLGKQPKFGTPPIDSKEHDALLGGDPGDEHDEKPGASTNDATDNDAADVATADGPAATADGPTPEGGIEAAHAKIADLEQRLAALEGKHGPADAAGGKPNAPSGDDDYDDF